MSGDQTERRTDGGGPTSLATDPRLVAIVSVSGVGVVAQQAVPAALPAISAGLGVSDAQIGLVMSVYFLLTLSVTPVVGAAADIYGRRPVTLSLTLLLGLAGVATFFVESFGALLALRAVQGAAFAAPTPLSVALIGDFFRGTAGTTAQGIRSSSNGAIIIVVPAAAGALAGISWQYPFLLFGLALPVVALVYVTLPEAHGRADDAVDRRVRDELRVYGERLIDTLDDRNLLILLLGGFALFVVRNGVLTIVPLFAVRVLGESTFVAGALLSMLGVVRVVVSPFSGHLLRFFSRRAAFAGTMIVVAASMVAFVLAISRVGAVVGVAGFAVGMSLFNPLLNDTVTAAADTESRAGVVSSVMIFKNVANAAAPAGFTLLLAATNFDTVFAVASAVALGYIGLIAVGFDEEY